MVHDLLDIAYIAVRRKIVLFSPAFYLALNKKFIRFQFPSHKMGELIRELDVTVSSKKD